MPLFPRRLQWIVIATTFAAAACHPGNEPLPDAGLIDARVPISDVPLAPFVPAAAVLPRLTVTQYRNATSDLLGVGLPAADLEPDTNPFLFTTIGAARATASERAVQSWESAALAATASVFQDPARRAIVAGCTPSTPDDSCVRTFVERFGRRAFRRPLSAAEVDRYVAVSRTLGAGNPWRGVRYAIAGILQSPHFLYRAEPSEPDVTNATRVRYTSWAMASRLAFVLWDSIPDDALLDAAAAGALTDPENLRTQARRMLRHPRARSAARTFFRQYLGLGILDGLNRERTLFPQMSQTLGPAMREEVELLVEDVVFTRNTDFRELFTSRDTFLNAELAALYGVALPSGATGFVRVALPVASMRGGILTTAAMLALAAHPNATSPTARGRFVRERLLCERVPDPPMNVQTDLTDPDAGTARTLRERLVQHRRAPQCAGCHSQTDPIGLGFEDFDAIGAHRTMEAGRAVDATGNLDGTPFVGARAIGALLRDRPEVADCVVLQLYRFANARLDQPSEQRVLAQLSTSFATANYRFQDLLVALVASDGFRYAAR